MAREFNKIPNFDEIVFEIRNKEYGAYLLRKSYSRNLLIAMMIGVSVVCTAVITPYYTNRDPGVILHQTESQPVITLLNPDQIDKIVAPPAPEPPPVVVVHREIYAVPDVVDSLNAGDMEGLLTADQAQKDVTDQKVVDISKDFRPDIPTDEPEAKIFIRVEEMPEFPGGEPQLIKYLAENTIYPDLARENNIQGKVFVKFVVTSEGGVDQVSILKGVDTELNAEAIRVVKTLPLFKPGKQGGTPVAVWFTVPINFQISPGYPVQ
jgi:periplasmic protein TonB